MPFTREVFPDTQRLLQRLYRQSRHHQEGNRAMVSCQFSAQYLRSRLSSIS